MICAGDGMLCEQNGYGVTAALPHEHSISDGRNYRGGCVYDGDGYFGVGLVPMLAGGSCALTD